MIATTISVNLPIFIPVIIAVITAIVGPIWLARHKENADERKERLDSSGELSVRIIDEGRDMRKELRDRVDSLETRLQEATKAFQDAMEEIRKLKSENDRFSYMIASLKEELDKMRQAAQLESLKRDDQITALEKTGKTEVADDSVH